MTGYINQIAGKAHSTVLLAYREVLGAGYTHEGSLGEPPTQKVSPALFLHVKKTTY